MTEDASAIRLMAQAVAADGAMAIVARILEMVGGTRPRLQAGIFIDHQVIIHMDAATYRGIELWYRWVYFIRNAGRLRDLRFIVLDAELDETETTTVSIVGRWSGRSKFREGSRTLSELVYFRYRLADNRVVELWTRRSNYTFILGSWIKIGAFYRLLIVWLFLYFWWLSCKNIDLRFDKA